jgi:hypothetical protein
MPPPTMLPPLAVLPLTVLLPLKLHVFKRSSARSSLLLLLLLLLWPLPLAACRLPAAGSSA